MRDLICLQLTYVDSEHSIPVDRLPPSDPRVGRNISVGRICTEFGQQRSVLGNSMKSARWLEVKGQTPLNGDMREAFLCSFGGQNSKLYYKASVIIADGDKRRTCVEETLSAISHKYGPVILGSTSYRI